MEQRLGQSEAWKDVFEAESLSVSVCRAVSPIPSIPLDCRFAVHREQTWHLIKLHQPIANMTVTPETAARH